MKTNEINLIDANYLDEKMGRLATRYAAIGDFETAKFYNFVRTVLDTAPIFDAEVVVHGHWVMPKESYGFVCSVCGGSCWYYDYDQTIGESNYCPNCGAKMDGETE